MAKGSLAKASTPEPFSTSKTSNWVARGGGLPDYIQHVAHALVRSGKTESEAIAMAIGIIKNWAHGKGNVDAETRAAATKALGEWTALKAKNAAKKAVKEAEACGMPHAKLWKDGKKKCPACGADLGAAVKEMAGEAVLALARRGALSEAGANQPRFKRSGKYTDPTRGIRKTKRSHADVLAELKAAGHAGNGEPDVKSG